MRPSSAKAKGRRAAKEAKDELLLAAPSLLPDDIVVTSSGDTGEDLKLSPAARRVYPLQFEVKNREKLNIWDAIDQAGTHGTHDPAVIFRKNGRELHIALSLKVFLKLCTGQK